MKKWLVSVLLILGGIMVFFSLNNVSQREDLDRKIQAEQKRMVIYLINNAKDIEKITFTNFVQNTKTGTWSSEVIVNDEIYLTLSITDFEGNISIAEHISQSKGKELEFKTIPTNNQYIDIDVIFYNGD